jgi:hypothetical protein
MAMTKNEIDALVFDLFEAAKRDGLTAADALVAVLAIPVLSLDDIEGSIKRLAARGPGLVRTLMTEH